MFRFIRWPLVAGLWLWAITSDTFWLGIIALAILCWPPPEDRFKFFYGPRGILNRNKDGKIDLRY